MKDKMIAWLTGPRDRREGASLYAQYGRNLRLKTLFAVDDTNMAKEMLIDEIRKLAGLSEAELAALPRKAKGAAEGKRRTADDRKPVAETVKKTISFRERFPFLQSPDCPDVLKIAVADMFTAHDQYKEAHAQLQAMPEDADAEATAALCRTIVENYLKNRGLWDEIDHFADTGKLIGKYIKLPTAAKDANALTQLTDVELVKKLQSARANISKRKKEIDSPDASPEAKERAKAALADWEKRRDAINSELDRRKKK